MQALRYLRFWFYVVKDAIMLPRHCVSVPRLIAHAKLDPDSRRALNEARAACRF